VLKARDEGWEYETVAEDIGAFLRVLQQASEKEFGIGFTLQT
jgi:hypothetical protein